MAITRTSLGLTFLFFIAWTPYATVALMGISGNQDRLTPGIIASGLSLSALLEYIKNQEATNNSICLERSHSKNDKKCLGIKTVLIKIKLVLGMTMLPALFAKSAACANPFVVRNL